MSCYIDLLHRNQVACLKQAPSLSPPVCSKSHFRLPVFHYLAVLTETMLLSADVFLEAAYWQVFNNGASLHLSNNL